MNFLGETLTVLGRTRPRNILFLILSFFGINFFFIKSIFFEKLKMVESRVTDLCLKRNSQTSQIKKQKTVIKISDFYDIIWVNLSYF